LAGYWRILDRKFCIVSAIRGSILDWVESYQRLCPFSGGIGIVLLSTESLSLLVFRILDGLGSLGS
jgi:hypothetical protein